LVNYVIIFFTDIRFYKALKTQAIGICPTKASGDTRDITFVEKERKDVDLDETRLAFHGDAETRYTCSLGIQWETVKLML
ncbi:hypothetical protein DXG03_000755, partial [Asterophora parasitica]